MPKRSIARNVLDRWRAAAQLMEALDLDAPEWHDACIEAQLAQAAYQQAIDDATGEHVQVPIPFDEATKGPDA